MIFLPRSTGLAYTRNPPFLPFDSPSHPAVAAPSLGLQDDLRRPLSSFPIWRTGRWPFPEGRHSVRGIVAHSIPLTEDIFFFFHNVFLLCGPDRWLRFEQLAVVPKFRLITFPSGSRAGPGLLSSRYPLIFLHFTFLWTTSWPHDPKKTHWLEHQSSEVSFSLPFFPLVWGEQAAK